MVPRFEKRVRSYAADVSGLAILTILTALGMPVFPGREYAQAAVMLVGFFLIIILPMILSKGQTFGKRMQKIKVVKLDGTDASILILVLREIFKYGLGIATFGVYIIVAYFTLTEKHVSRTIHDYIFKTKVIDLDTSPQNVRNNKAIRTKTMRDTDLD
jgi:uncharacterized RDD family membrane protein YckC